MKKILILFFTLLSIQALDAQSRGKITGSVVDAASGEPLPGCNVVIEKTNMGAATDAEGRFVILNVPPGQYDVKAMMIGYQAQVQKGVKVVTNLTVNVNFKLSSAVVEGEEVTVVSYKIPPVQKDLTYKVQARTAAEISRIPITTVNDLLIQQAGIVQQIRTAPVSSLPVFGQFATVPSDGLHFRGGRENEALYLLDGINVTDGLWGGYSIDQIGELAINSMETYSGTFDPQYGKAMSGVVNISMPNYFADKLKFSAKGFTDKHGVESVSHNTYSGEVALSSALPFYKKLGLFFSHRTYSTDGYIYGYIYPEYVNSEGRDKSGVPEEVPMQYLDTQFSMGKAVWTPVSDLKIIVGGYTAKTNRGVYNHYFKYNPYGTPRVRLNDDLVYSRLNYSLSKKSYFTLYGAYYDRGFLSTVYDDPALYDVLPQTGTAEFSVTGEDWVYFDTRFKRKELGLDYFWQINKIHQFTAGLSYDKLQTDLARRNPDGGIALEEYSYQPVEISGYVHDKMEFNDMGMIINAGLRFDYIDPKRKVLASLSDLADIEAPMVDAKSEFFVNPRFGISFPVADKSAVRFGYGHYYQYPNYFKVYQGTYYLQAAGVYRPNPQLENTPIAQTTIEPEKTVNYEVGVQNRLTNEISVDITAFYRKTSNLIGIIMSETNEGKRFQTMGNIDYATVKGIELSLKKEFSDHFSAFLNYTFTRTLVSTSVLFEMPTDETRTFPANWDQPHSLSGSIHYEADSGFGFSLYGSASSGFPYTRSAFDPNGERAPWMHQLDLNLFKNFTFKKIKQQVYIQILNVPNRKNIWWVYADSGIPGDDANEATSHDYTNNPSMYGPGRVVQIGLKIWN